MRHSKKRHKLGVTGSHRLALLANLSVALITHGRIRTTLAKAKALRPFIEKVITMAKKAESSNEAERKLHFRRLAISRINDPKAVAKLFDERVSEFMQRSGGYTRIYKIGQRIGDAAEMALIELIDGNDEGYTKRPSKKVTGSAAEKASVATETVGAPDKEVAAKNADTSETKTAAEVKDKVTVDVPSDAANEKSGVHDESSDDSENDEAVLPSDDDKKNS